MFKVDTTVSTIALRQKENSQEEETVSSVHSFPDELLIKIFSYFSPNELLQIAQVSTHWKAVALDPLLWTDFSCDSLSFAGDGQGGEAYKHSKIAHRALKIQKTVRSFLLETPVYRCKHYYEPLLQLGLESRLIRHPTNLIISDSGVIATMEGRRNYHSFVYDRSKAGFQSGMTYRWDLNSGKLCGIYQALTEGVLDLACNGDLLAALLSDEVKVCDLESGELLSSFKIENRPKQKLDWQGELLLISYQADDLTYILETRNSATGCLEGISKDFYGKDLKLAEDKVITYDSFHAYIYDLETGQQLHALEHPQKYYGLNSSIERLDVCDNRIITTTLDCTRIWDLQSGELLSTQEKHIDTSSYGAKNNEYLLLSGDKTFRFTSTGKVQISDFKTGELIQSYATGLGTEFKRHLHVTKDKIIFDTAFGIKVLSLKQEHILHPNSPLQQQFNPSPSFKISLDTLTRIDQISERIKSLPFVFVDLIAVAILWIFTKLFRLKK